MSRLPDTHAEAWALLPWLANGRLAPDEREWVDAHVSTCAECREELAQQRKIANEMSRAEAMPPASAGDEQRSFNKLWARIEAAESAAPASAPQLIAGGTRSSRAVRWLAAAVVVQAIGLGVIGVTAFNRPAFKTVADLETPRSNAPAVRLVFQPNTSIGTINTLLIHQGLTLVEGPGDAGNFRAELSADAVASGATADKVAAVLSKDPNVSFAQPIAR